MMYRTRGATDDGRERVQCCHAADDIEGCADGLV